MIPALVIPARLTRFRRVDIEQHPYGRLSAPDRTLEHSLTYALIEIGDPRGAAEGLRNAGSRTRRAALVALDQMNGDGLDPVQAAALLTASDPHRFHPRTDPDLAAHNSPSRPSLWK